MVTFNKQNKSFLIFTENLDGFVCHLSYGGFLVCVPVSFISHVTVGEQSCNDIEYKSFTTVDLNWSTHYPVQ